MSTYIPVALRRGIRAQFADCCAYCQTAESLSVATFEIDHIIPTSADGETQADNLCLACPSCNRYKSDRQTGVASEPGEVVALFHPQQHRWRDHFAWSADAAEIIPLTPVGVGHN